MQLLPDVASRRAANGHPPIRWCLGAQYLQRDSNSRRRVTAGCQANSKESQNATLAEAAEGVQNAIESSTDAGSLGELAAGVVQPSTSAQSLGSLALLISPFFFWGTSMVAMKALSPHTTPLFVSAVRMLPAGLALIAWAARDGRPQPSGWKAWAWIAAFALADATAFQGFLALGLQKTAAGLGSVIIDSQPLSVAILAGLLFGETIGPWGYLGLGVGVLGLCLLELSPSALAPLLSFHMPAQSMAIGTILVRYVSRYADPVMATGYHMLIGGIPLMILSAQQESTLLVNRLPMFNGLDALLLTYISLLGSAASYGVFFYKASTGNLTALSSLTFSTPCFAAATGFLFFGESLTPLQLFGAAVTLGGVFLISRPSESS